MAFQTEVEFRLPKGYIDSQGVLHTEGVMRLATAADEILPLKDPRVQQNPAYLTIIVLARVITRLGGVPDVNTKVVEGLFAEDLNHLQELYERLNSGEAEATAEELPRVAAAVGGAGEIGAHGAREMAVADGREMEAARGRGMGVGGAREMGVLGEA